MESAPIDSIMEELGRDPRRPALVVDERRFGSRDGLESEVVLFAGVRTTVREVFGFAAAVQSVRQTLDEQKRFRAIKAADVLRGRLAQHLVGPCAQVLSWSSVEYWASTTRHLVGVKRERPRPAALVVAGSEAGRSINGQETPVLEMIAGLVADELQAPRLEVFVDRSTQNGLHEQSDGDFVVWDQLSTATAIRDGRSVTLGSGCQIRHWALSERTRVFGDVVLLGDLCAHLWGLNPEHVDRLRNRELATAVQRIGTAPGLLVAAELRRRVAPEVAQRG